MLVRVDDKNVLLTYDVIMSTENLKWCAWYSKPLIIAGGFKGKALIPSKMIKLQKEKGVTRQQIKSKLLEVAKWSIDLMVTAHGPPLTSNVNETLKRSIDKHL